MAAVVVDDPTCRAKANAKNKVPLFLCPEEKVPLFGTESEELIFKTEEPSESLSRIGNSGKRIQGQVAAGVPEVPLFLSPERLAELAEVSPRAVRKAISEGRIRVAVATAGAGHHKGRPVHTIALDDGFAFYPKAKSAWDAQQQLRANQEAAAEAEKAAKAIQPPSDPNAIPDMKEWQRKHMDARLGLLRYVEALMTGANDELFADAFGAMRGGTTLEISSHPFLWTEGGCFGVASSYVDFCGKPRQLESQDWFFEDASTDAPWEDLVGWTSVVVNGGPTWILTELSYDLFKGDANAVLLEVVL
jgi:hypothetical protein